MPDKPAAIMGTFVQSKAKDAVVEAASRCRGSMRAFLRYFNPNELREDRGRQWHATNEMLERLEDKLAALGNLPSVAKQGETEN